MPPALCKMARAVSRRLQRNSSSDEAPVETKKVMCIRGMQRKAWMVLPVVEVHGRQCVSVSKWSAPWLHHLLGGRRRSEKYGVYVANFVAEFVKGFRQLAARVTRSARLRAKSKVGRKAGRP